MQDMIFNDIALLIGRIIFGGVFIYMGANHFLKREMMTQYAQMKKVPMAQISVLIAGALLVFGGISILTGAARSLGALALIAFFVPTTLLIHNFWTIDDEQMKQGEKTNFLKNSALLGAALMVLGYSGNWEYAINLNLLSF